MAAPWRSPPRACTRHAYQDQHAAVLVYALGGKDTLRPTPTSRCPEPAGRYGDRGGRRQGFKIFHPTAANCHGDAAVSGSFIPDLQHSGTLSDATAWEKIVLGGERKARGMVSFAEELNKDDIEAVRAYVIHRAHQTLAEQKAAKPAG